MNRNKICQVVHESQKVGNYCLTYFGQHTMTLLQWIPGICSVRLSDTWQVLKSIWWRLPGNRFALEQHNTDGLNNWFSKTWLVVYCFSLQLMMLCHGARIGFNCGDIRLILDDMACLRPTVFPTVPRLLNRVYDKVNRSGQTVVASCQLTNLIFRLHKWLTKEIEWWPGVKFWTLVGNSSGSLKVKYLHLCRR